MTTMRGMGAVWSLALGLTMPAGAAEYYVVPGGDDANPGTRTAPFATLERARDAVAAASGEGGEAVTVFLRGGVHARAGPLRLGPEHSGSSSAPVLYTSAPGEEAILDGGRRIAGWVPRADGTWTADLPDVKGGGWRFRQLYVNGQQRPRARIPNEGFLRVAGCPEGTPRTVHYHTDCRTFRFKPGDLRADWRNLRDVEVIVYLSPRAHRPERDHRQPGASLRRGLPERGRHPADEHRRQRGVAQPH